MSDLKSNLESHPVIVRLYSKPGCHLCEQAREMLERVRSRLPFQLVEEDIRASPSVFATYRYSIPVVILATGEVLHHPLEEARVEASLRKASHGTPIAGFPGT
jgi:hypothetical protein